MLNAKEASKYIFIDLQIKNTSFFTINHIIYKKANVTLQNQIIRVNFISFFIIIFYKDRYYFNY